MVCNLYQIKSLSVQFSSVDQSCLTLCNPMNCSTPGLPVHHQLMEFTQTHVHQVSDAIQPYHPLSSPSPPASNPSQHQSLFQWVNSLHEVAKVPSIKYGITIIIDHLKVYVLFFYSSSEVTQSCPTLCNPVDCSPPGSSVMGFSRQEYWSGLPFTSAGHLPNPGFEPRSPALQADALTSEPSLLAPSWIIVIWYIDKTGSAFTL